MKQAPPSIFLAVTHTVRSKARTGVQTVVRGLIHGLIAMGADLCLVRRRKGMSSFSLVPARLFPRLSPQLAGIPSTSRGRPGQWFLIPEVIYNRRDHIMMRKVRERGMRVGVIFHDAIPVIEPSLVRREAAEQHAAYMVMLTETDVVMPVSNTAAEQFREFVGRHGLRLPPIRVCRLAGEILGGERSMASARPDTSCIRILCVSTLDPRKNHQTLIRAFDLACAKNPGTELFIDLIGAPYKDAGHIVEAVVSATKTNPRITWHGAVSVEKLSELYSRCDFTVYPSILEGFGLPILESLWHGRPCICANFGAMAETAAAGGCLMVDVRDPEQLCDAITTLVGQPGVRHRLAGEINQRSFKSWPEYAGEICGFLASVPVPPSS